MKPSTLSWYGLLEASALCLCVLSIIHWAAGFHFFLELLAHFKAAYGLLSALLAAFFVWRRSWVWAGLLGIAVVANVSAIAPWYLSAANQSQGQIEPTLKVLLANVMSANTEYDRLLELVQHERPDVVVLQEMNRQWESAMGPMREIYPSRLEVVRNDNFGVAVYSAKPWSDARSIPSPPLGFPTLIVDHAGGRALRLITTHPHTPLGQWGFDARNTQLMDIASYVQESKLPVLVIGDLNATLWSPVLLELMETAGLRNVRRGFGLQATWPTWFAPLMIPIDHGLSTPDLNVHTVRTGPAIGSDHLPLIIELSVL